MSTGIPGFFELLMLVAVIAVVAVFFRLILKGPRRGGDDGYRQDQPASEAEMLRELHQGLLRMEKRIEALETLLLDREEEARRSAAGEKRP